ncbi:MAG: hypothetical protein SGCHY_002065 [Lobulomycetales sp.]
MLDFRPGSRERSLLQDELVATGAQPAQVPFIINGKPTMQTNALCLKKQIMPCRHADSLCVYSEVEKQDGVASILFHSYRHIIVVVAIDTALAAKSAWEQMPFEDRAAVFLKAADLLVTKYRYRMMAATMLGQGKNVWQAEIDCVAELADFWRFNCFFAEKIYKGGNLPSAPALMGNVVLWKPSPSAIYSNYLVMEILREAGLPDGVIQFIPGDPSIINEVAFSHPDFAGLHFTGSTQVFTMLNKQISENLHNYKSYPRIVGETGDLSSFMTAVINKQAYDKITGIVSSALASDETTLLAGGGYSDTTGYFVEPTVLVTRSHEAPTMKTEIFGPVVTCFVYPAADWRTWLDTAANSSDYALTGAIFARERSVLREATNALRHAAGNFYVNDKCTGAVVGQQPFGGGRASGTNDKAGSAWNLVRWVSPRTIKENYYLLADYKYPSNH